MRHLNKRVIKRCNPKEQITSTTSESDLTVFTKANNGAQVFRRHGKKLRAVFFLLAVPALLWHWYQPPSCDHAYFLPRKERQFSLDYSYIHDAKDVCAQSNSTDGVTAGIHVVILVLSVSQRESERQAIRSTYGSVSRGSPWPAAERQEPGERQPERVPGSVRVVFLIGQNKDVLRKAREAQLVAAESRMYGDMVQWDGLVEDYSNLTLKVLLGLRWVKDHCPHATHVVKTDDDVFIHVPRLLRYITLNYPPSPDSSVSIRETQEAEITSNTVNRFPSKNGVLDPLSPRVPFTRQNGRRSGPERVNKYDATNTDIIHGAWLGGAAVQRSGKYKTSFRNNEEGYPFHVHPLNVKGAMYFMHSSLAMQILSIAEHIPYTNLEDVHVTGILACAVGARHTGLTMGQIDFCNTDPKPCDFADGVRIASRDVSPEMFNKIWRTFDERDICSKFWSELSFFPEFFRFPKCLLLER